LTCYEMDCKRSEVPWRTTLIRVTPDFKIALAVTSIDAKLCIVH